MIKTAASLSSLFLFFFTLSSMTISTAGSNIEPCRGADIQQLIRVILLEKTPRRMLHQPLFPTDPPSPPTPFQTPPPPPPTDSSSFFPTTSSATTNQTQQQPQPHNTNSSVPPTGLSQSNHSSSLKPIGTVAVAVGASLILLLIAFAALCFVNQRQKKKNKSTESEKFLGQDTTATRFRSIPPTDNSNSNSTTTAAAAASRFLYIGTVDPSVSQGIRSGEVLKKSPHNSLGDGEVHHNEPSPELQPIPVFTVGNCPPRPNTTTTTVESDDDDDGEESYHTATKSLNGNSPNLYRQKDPTIPTPSPIAITATKFSSSSHSSTTTSTSSGSSKGTVQNSSSVSDGASTTGTLHDSSLYIAAVSPQLQPMAVPTQIPDDDRGIGASSPLSDRASTTGSVSECSTVATGTAITASPQLRPMVLPERTPLEPTNYQWSPPTRSLPNPSMPNSVVRARERTYTTRPPMPPPPPPPRQPTISQTLRPPIPIPPPRPPPPRSLEPLPQPTHMINGRLPKPCPPPTIGAQQETKSPSVPDDDTTKTVNSVSENGADQESGSDQVDAADSVVNSRPRLKPLHWDKVCASSGREMIWDRLKSSSFKLNEDMIETLFMSNPAISTRKEASRKPAESISQEIRILDVKKSQNVAILLRALNVTREEVCQALLEGNPDGLRADLLENIIKMAPTKEEELKLKDYAGDITKLGIAERFLKEILNIPFAFKRIEAMLYMDNFEAEVNYIRNSFETIEAACEELRTSRLFLRLLEAVLKTGNRMNIGTNRGDAEAFKLDTLLKLADVKGTDGKTTLLHFVVQEIIRSEGQRISREGEGQNEIDKHGIPRTTYFKLTEQNLRKQGLKVVCGLSSELDNVKRAAGMDSDVLSSYVAKLALGLEKVNSVLQLEHPQKSENEAKFFESMEEFLDRAEGDILRVKAEETVAFSLVKEITEYFHGDAVKEEAHPFRIFMIVRDFLTVLDRVCREVGNLNERRVIVGSARSFPISTRTPYPVFSRPQVKESSSDDDSLSP